MERKFRQKNTYSVLRNGGEVTSVEILYGALSMGLIKLDENDLECVKCTRGALCVSRKALTADANKTQRLINIWGFFHEDLYELILILYSFSRSECAVLLLRVCSLLMENFRFCSLLCLPFAWGFVTFRIFGKISLFSLSALLWLDSMINYHETLDSTQLKISKTNGMGREKSQNCAEQQKKKIVCVHTNRRKFMIFSHRSERASELWRW